MSETQANQAVTPVATYPTPTLPGVVISSSAQILSRESRLCTLIWSPSGYGKTKLAGSLDAMTRKYRGKRTLYIPVEAGEGGGAATIRKLDIPMYVPTDYSDFYKVLGALRNDKTIGGIVLDSGSEFAKQHVKTAALKYPARENVATRAAGIATRSDYQTMGELMSQSLRLLIGLTTHPNPEYRKDLIVTATDVTREEDEKVVFIGPDLPGRMAREAVQMFQQCSRLEIKPEMVDGKRQLLRYLVTSGDGVYACKDRLQILPERIRIKADASDPNGEDILTMWEKFYLPTINAL